MNAKSVPWLTTLAMIVVVLGCGFPQQARGGPDAARAPWSQSLPMPEEPVEPPSDAPPLSPDRWRVVPGHVLEEGDIWGMRVSPVAAYSVSDGLILFYTSLADQGMRDDAQRVQRLRDQRLAENEAGSLAFSKDLIHWIDHPRNPILNEARHAWQSTHRVLLLDVVHDAQNGQWVAFFGDNGGVYPGKRAVGVAYSRDGYAWRYVDRPILTIADFIRVHPPRNIEATEAMLRDHGRVYLRWAHHHQGMWYVCISGTYRFRPTRAMASHILVADTAEGPFQPVTSADSGEWVPTFKPAYWQDRWYAVYTDRWNGKAGIGLAVAETIAGPYRKLSEDHPLFEIEATGRSQPLLFHHNGIWAVAFTSGGHWSEPLRLRLALADEKKETP